MKALYFWTVFAYITNTPFYVWKNLALCFSFSPSDSMLFSISFLNNPSTEADIPDERSIGTVGSESPAIGRDSSTVTSFLEVSNSALMSRWTDLGIYWWHPTKIDTLFHDKHVAHCLHMLLCICPGPKLIQTICFDKMHGPACHTHIYIYTHIRAKEDKYVCQQKYMPVRTKTSKQYLSWILFLNSRKCACETQKTNLNRLFYRAHPKQLSTPRSSFHLDLQPS